MIAECVFCSRWNKEPELRIAEFEQSYLMLNRDQFFAGYCLLFAKKHVTELFHLVPQARHTMIDEVSRAAEALFNVFKPQKMNYELLGNMVPHIHWHLVPRYSDDPLFPRPVWAEPHEELHLDPSACQQRIEMIKGAI